MIWTASFNGLTFGAGTTFLIDKWEGFDDLPDVESNDVQRPQDSGELIGTDFAKGRVMTLTLIVKGAPDLTTLESYISQITAAFNIGGASELPLVFNGSTRQVNVRCRRRHIARDRDLMFGLFTIATLELHATDPRVYDAVLQQIVTGLSQNTNGMTFNALFNLGFGGAASGGLITAVNAGNTPTRPKLTIQGPVTNPIVTNQTAGKSLKLNIVLASTDSIVIDTDAKSITLNGTASRRSALTSDSQWWDLAPGQSTILFSNNGAYNAQASLSMAFRSAWI